MHLLTERVLDDVPEMEVSYFQLASFDLNGSGYSEYHELDIAFAEEFFLLDMALSQSSICNSSKCFCTGQREAE